MDNQNSILSKSTIEKLNKKISRLRSFIYILVAVFVLFTFLSMLWIYNSYNTETSFETYYSTPPQPPKAALYLTPQSGNFNVGDEFPIDVLINTEGSNVVAAAAFLSFNKKYLEVISVDLSDSLFNITFENTVEPEEGKIRIAVAKPTPGVKNNAGKIATVRFRALESVRPYTENVYFDFTKGSTLYSAVILDDKKGTNTLDATRGSKIIIN